MCRHIKETRLSFHLPLPKKKKKNKKEMALDFVAPDS